MAKTKDANSKILNGPRDTKRFGRSLIIDLASPQLGLVVERGSSLPRASVVVTTCAREIIVLSKEGIKVESIILVGSDADPAHHPDLREITENLRALRDKWFSRARLLVFTKTRDMSSYELRATLAMYNAVHLQFDWGTAKNWTATTGEKGTDFAKFVTDCHHFDHLVLETALYKSPIDNMADAEITAMSEKLAEIKPQEVVVMCGGGSAADKKGVKYATKPQRDKIVEKLAEATGIAVHPDEFEELLPA
ncbi:MAG: hypothetical protein ACJA2W_001553 [Planctomycetota bacterium]|jgi:hypothetical protein